jgi:DNA-binding response OmpR family regulator
MIPHSALRIPHSISLLLVDDKPANLLSLEALLEGLEYHLVKALSGEEGLRHLLAQDFAVILLDVQMPRLDGFETARLIRARESSRLTPIIFVTAEMKTEEMVMKGCSLGAVDYLVKPLVPEILRAKVEGFVERKQAEIERERLIHELQEALARVKTLSGFLPICAWCNRIRVGQNHWHQMETYVAEHTEAQFSHGVCPDCARDVLRPED